MINSNKMNCNELIKEIKNNADIINDLDKHDYNQLVTLEQAFDLEPSLYFHIDTDVFVPTENIMISVVKAFPNIICTIPDELKTAKVKMACLQSNPQTIELFEYEDITEEMIKYMFINYNELISDFEDDKKNILIKKYVSDFIKQGVIPKD